MPQGKAPKSSEEGKLGSLLSLLSAQQWEKFRIFLASPYFNRSQPVRSLLECYAQSPANAAVMQEESLIFSRLFPNQPYDGIKMKNLRAALQRKLDLFLTQIALDSDQALQHRLLLMSLNNLAENHYFLRYYEKATESTREMRLDEEQMQLFQFHLDLELETSRARTTERGQSGLYSTTAFQHAWQFFQLQTLKYLVRLENFAAMTGQRQSDKNAESVLQLIDLGENASPAMVLIHDLLLVYRNPTDRLQFDRLRNGLNAFGLNLSFGDATDIYAGAINHCIRRINTGADEYREEMLDMYKEMDTRKLLLINGKISAAQFKNMVALALRCHSLDWANSIIERYGKLLDHDPFGNAQAFNQGMLYFSKGEYAAAERCFHQVLGQFEDIFYGLDARSYLLRVYYETGNIMGLESLAESFKMYVKRNKRIPKAHKLSYSTTVNIFRKLIKIQPWDKASLQNLRDDISKNVFAANSKQWILGKVDQLLAKP